MREEEADCVVDKIVLEKMMRVRYISIPGIIVLKKSLTGSRLGYPRGVFSERRNEG